LVPEKISVENMVTGRVEVLTVNRTRYGLDSYVPDDPESSSLIGLVWMNDATVRLVDKLGNEFQFDGLGRTTQMIIGDGYHIDYKYDRERIDATTFDKAPYQLNIDGSDREEIAGGKVKVPARLILSDERNVSQEIFTLDKRPSHRFARWLPQSGAASNYQFMVLMTDGSFRVEARDGNELVFDPGGRFRGITVPVLRALRQDDQRIELDYEYHNGQFRVRQARVMKEGLSASLYSIGYGYAPDGRLASVTGPDGTLNDIRYNANGVSMTARR